MAEGSEGLQVLDSQRWGRRFRLPFGVSVTSATSCQVCPASPDRLSVAKLPSPSQGNGGRDQPAGDATCEGPPGVAIAAACLYQFNITLGFGAGGPGLGGRNDEYDRLPAL